MNTDKVFNLAAVAMVLVAGTYAACASPGDSQNRADLGQLQQPHRKGSDVLADPNNVAQKMLQDGQQIFRYDTYGDEAFWTGKLRLQEVVAGLSPKTALSLGLKVDVDALPENVVQALQHGEVDLDDPAVTATLLKQKAVLGVVGTFDQNDKLSQVGFSCALCHSTVDNSLTAGVGHRLDGMANHDLNVGAIVATAPNLQPVVDLLKHADPSIDSGVVKQVLNSWGPGKYDAELLLDGKAFQPDGRSAATLIPSAGGLAGHNLHTWTGGWGSIPYWNAFVAVTQMHGIGSFFDPRLDNAEQYPVAAAAKLGHISVDPDQDQVTSKLPALQLYQLSLPAPKPTAGKDFNADAAERGDKLFSGKAACNNCHHEPLWTEPGWNTHNPSELKIDSFQADRSPDHSYRTANLAGLFVREQGLFMNPENKGRFYHDGRFQTLREVVDSYDERFSLGLTDAEKTDLVEYLKSL